MHCNCRYDDAVLSMVNLIKLNTELSILTIVGKTIQQGYLCHCNNIDKHVFLAMLMLILCIYLPNNRALELRHSRIQDFKSTI